MTATRWLAARSAIAVAGVTGAAALVLALVELVERGGRHPSAELADLLALVAFRLPGGLRELLPLLVAVAVAVAVGALRRRGELLGLGVAGVGGRSLTSGLVVGASLVGLVALGTIEVALPRALDRAAELAARVEGRQVEVAGGWAVRGDQALRIERVDDRTLHGVTLVERQGAELSARWEAPVLRWDGTMWAGAGTVRTWEGPTEAVDALPLPAPEELSGVLERRAPSERGASQLDAEDPWRTWRLAGFVLLPLWAWGAAAAGLRSRFHEVALAAGVALAGGAAWLAALALVGSSAPGAVLVGAALPAVAVVIAGSRVSPG